MKRALIIMCIGFLLLSLAGCQRYPWTLVESDLVISGEDVSLSIVGDYMTEKEVMLYIENNSTEEIIYGEPYFLQVMEDGQWYDIDVASDWPAVGCIAEPGHCSGRMVNWSEIYGDLPKGSYRIVQEYSKAPERDVKHFAAYSFEVK